MIEGVQILPWMGAHERMGRGKYECGPCMRANTAAMRSRMACGWLRTSELGIKTKGWGAIGPHSPDWCPGYTTQLPEVQEAARAWGWNEKGGFVPRYQALGMPINDELSDLVDIFAGEQARAEQWEIEQRANRSK